jgi:hypothetical protein
MMLKKPGMVKLKYLKYDFGNGVTSVEQARSPAAKRDIKTRQHLMERSFACGSRYGLQRARWRRLWRVQIQEYLTASIQNMMVLLRYIKEPTAALGKTQATGIHPVNKLLHQQQLFWFRIKLANFFKNKNASIN